MGVWFTTRTGLGAFSEEKISKLITRLDSLGLVLRAFRVGPFSEYHDTLNQQERLFRAEYLINRVLHGFASGSIYFDTLKVITIGTYFWDALVIFSLHLNTSNNQLAIRIDNNIWKRDFSRAHESYIYDNGRCARLFLDVVELFIIQDFIIKSDYEYLDSELPQNCLAIALAIGSEFYEQMINNILFSNYFITLAPEDIILPKIDKVHAYLLKQGQASAFAEIYLKNKETVFAKLIINREKSHVFLFPLAPYKMKTFDNESGINLQFYLRLLLNICNQFPIRELRTTIT